MKKRPPAVAMPPALLLDPVFCLASGRPGVVPRGTSQANLPVLAFTAIKRPQGGRKQGAAPRERPSLARRGAEKFEPDGAVRMYSTFTMSVGPFHFGFFVNQPMN